MAIEQKSKPGNEINEYVPQRKDFTTHEQWDAHRQSYMMIFELQKKVEELKAAPSNIRPAAPPSSALNSLINGIAIKAGIPTAGQTIRFNAATGQFEFGA